MGDQNIYFSENTGNGIFNNPISISNLYPNIKSIYVFDINQDGFDDFLISGDEFLVQYINNGNSTFTDKKLYHFDWQSRRIELADLNNDGFIDIVSQDDNSNGSDLVYFKNNGNHQFFAPVNIYENFNFQFSSDGWAIGDHDMDNDLDLFFYNDTTNSLDYLENNGFGVFSTPVSLFGGASGGYGSIIFSDYDLDGDNDIFYNWRNYRINLGGGTFSTELNYTSHSEVRGIIEITQVNNDSLPDLLCLLRGYSSAPPSAIISYLNDSTGGFPFYPDTLLNLFDHDLHGFVREVGFNDLNNDNLPDIIFTYDSIFSEMLFVSYNLDSLNFSPPIPVYGTLTIRDLAFLDVDGNGFTDILAASSSGPKTFLNNGNQTFSGPYSDPMSGFCNDIEIGDLDNDFDQDIIAHQQYVFEEKYNYGINWYENNNILYRKILGKIFLDSNQNGEMDSLEFGLPNFNIESISNASSTISNDTGTYILNFDYASLGIHDVTMNLDPLWYLTSSPASYTFSLTQNFATVDTFNFAVYPDTILPLIDLNLSGAFPRCSDTIQYAVQLNNIGTTIPSGYLCVELDTQFTYFNSNITPDSIIANNIYFHYDSLNYFQNIIYTLKLITPDFTSSGDTLHFKATAYIDTISQSQYFTSDSLAQILVCAYDPNDKTSNPMGIDSAHVIDIDQNELFYTIRFQNTGTDTATNIRIKDQIDLDLQLSSLEIVASSHPYTIEINPNRIVFFKFDNIQLPDSSIDFSGSQGFIKYKVQIDSNTSHGTQILNFAEIFFDSNPGIITNTSYHTIFDCTNIPSFTFSNVESCIGDTVSFIVEMPYLLQTDFEWYLNSMFDTTGLNYICTLDNSGLNEITLRSMNELCIQDTIYHINVFTLPEITELSISSTPVCQNGIFPVTTLPSGGTLTGIGINGFDFDSGITGEGLFWIYYEFTDTNGCTIIDSIDITVEDCFVGLDNKGQNPQLNIFPNPSTNKVNIEFSSSTERRLFLLNQNGRVVKDLGVSYSDRFTFNKGQLNSGSFILMINEVQSEKVFFHKIFFI